MSTQKPPPIGAPKETDSALRFAQKLADIRGALALQQRPSVQAQIGLFQILEKIGQGADAAVYRAAHIHTGQTCAIKILHMSHLEQDKAIARFQREALVLETLSNPHVVSLIDFGMMPNAEGFYLVTELLQGKNLKQLIQAGESFHMTRIARIFAQICQAIHHAHERGIFHRDIKPANIFLEQIGGTESVKVIDFGVAAMADTDDDLTGAGMQVGTPHYMSPEQALGQSRDASAQSDLYSLGVVLYELLTGALPFSSENPVGMIFHHAYTPPPRLSEAFPLQPWSPLLDAFFERALAKSPQLRPANALIFQEECHRALASQQQLRFGHDSPMATASQSQLTALPPIALEASLPIDEETEDYPTFQGQEESELPPFGKPLDLPRPPWAERPAESTVADNDAFRWGDAKPTESSLTILDPLEFALPTVTGVSNAIDAQPNAAQVALEDIEQTSVVDPESQSIGPHVQLRMYQNSLPIELDPWIGREQELRKLALHFSLGSRLLCLSGAPGIGKTRLMQHFGRINSHQYPGGVWYCDLSTADHLASLCRLMSEGLGVPLTQHNDVVQLGDAIEGRGRCLLLLDHCANLAGYFSQTIALWMQRAQQAHFLFASQETFALLAEDTLALSPLSPIDALQLLEKRTHTELSRHRETERTLARLIGQTGGLPLAIELAAGEVAQSSATDFLQALDQRPHEERKDPLHNIMALVWSHLSPTERTALLCAIPFGGQLSPDKFLAVLADKQCTAPTSVLERLIRRGLLQEIAPIHGIKRLRIPPSLQRYILQRKDTSLLELMKIEGLYCERYAADGNPQGLEALWPQDALALFARQLERTERIQAIQWALRYQRIQLASQILVSMLPVFEEQGPLTEASQLGQELLKHPQAEKLSPLHLAYLQWTLARIDEELDLLPAAQERLQLAHQLAQQTGNHRLLGMILTSVGDLQRKQGLFPQARQSYEAALPMHQQSTDTQAPNHLFVGLTQCGIGIVSAELGLSQQSEMRYEEAYMAFRQAGNRRREGTIFALWGNLSAQRGRYSEAFEFTTQALTVAHQSDDWRLEGQTLVHQGGILIEQGRLAKARERLEAALALYRSFGHRNQQSTLLDQLGRLCMQQRDSLQATHYLEQAIHTAREVGDLVQMGLSHGQLGELMMAMGQMQGAWDHLKQAVLIFKNVRSPREGIYLGALAELMIEQHKYPQAIEHFQRGEALLRQAQDNHELARLLCRRALLEYKSQQIELAKHTYQQAEALAESANTPHNTTLARALSRLKQMLA